jgi:dienelactone hydrolase
MIRILAALALAAALAPAQELPAPDTDLRTMLRRHVVRRATELMEASAERRRTAIGTRQLEAYRARLRASLAEMLGPLPFAARGGALHVRPVSRHVRAGYVIENVLYESLPGWDVNATLFLPDPARFPAPWPAIVIPVGHSGKQFESYQVPAQVFARAGYAALLFDPPGQSGEKRTGNDHFRDGVRCYLTGATSQRFFVLDALRSIDYLATRPDIDMRNGVGITGVSGGGFTALYATLLDDRNRASGPSCFAAPEREHPLLDLYPPCPETLAFGLYPRGLDALSLLVAACPTPLLMMAGERDEVFKAGWMRAMAAEVSSAYSAGGRPERFRFFLDQSGHAYTVAQAIEFLHWMDRWVRAEPARTLPVTAAMKFDMVPEALLKSAPRQDTNMRTVVAAEAARLAATRPAPRLPLPAPSAPVPAAKRSRPFQVWADTLEELLLRTDTDIELPATFLTPLDGKAPGAELYFDDRGRWTELAGGARLARVAGFLNRTGAHPAVLTVDLRGWGDTSPAPAPYETVGWAAPQRWLGYASAALGDPVLSMRIRDGLAALAWLRAQPGIPADRIVVGGHGMGGVVALEVAARDARLAGVFATAIPASFEHLAGAPEARWPHDAYLPGVLTAHDLPVLAAALKIPVWVENPLDARMGPLAAEEAARLYPARVAAHGKLEDWLIGCWK